jgi:hypothetical protein
MPYADRATQLQYLKDRRKKLKVGRKVNQSPYGSMDMVDNDFKMRQLAPSIKITPPKPRPAPYDRKNSIEKEKPFNAEEAGLQRAEYIFV